MRDQLDFYFDGQWRPSTGGRVIDVINPATERESGRITLASASDVNEAVSAAKRAFGTFAETTAKERRALLLEIIANYERRFEDMAVAISEEMGAPIAFAREAQAQIGLGHLRIAADAMEIFPFEERMGRTRIRREPVGVCALITPWNWPVNQIVSKVAPALATGCTMVLKPSEIAPYSARVWTEIMDAAGVPAGVFNMINGDGQGAGAWLSGHPDIDMVSFTGSSIGGVSVASVAAGSVKRVHQELGGKSAKIVINGPCFEAAIRHCVRAVVRNAGQSCNAPTRLLVQRESVSEAARIARDEMLRVRVGNPLSDADLGPVVSERQWRKIQDLIGSGVAEGAQIECGGAGRPAHLPAGYYVRPTLFSNVSNDMRIAREEIFGPVLVIIAYDDLDDAVRIANDTPYGLAAYVSGADVPTAERLAARLRAGQITIDDAPADLRAPFGGFKQSGNGREWGAWAFHDFVELKAVIGAEDRAA